jgi:uncharacterized protein YndB with AHSA1/START domain
MSADLAMDFVINKEDITVNVTREFAANQELVWEAWTNPEILDQWWAPKPFASRTKSMDFKVGGRRLYAMVSPEGTENWSAQEYTSISPITNFKFLSLFTDEDGNANTAFSASEWDVNFNEDNGITTVNITIQRNSLEELEQLIQMGFKEGFTMALKSLGELLESLKK